MSSQQDIPEPAPGRKRGEYYTLPGASGHATEHGRLDLQHHMLTRLLHGLCIKPDLVERTLTPKGDGHRPAVLDVGTGTGAWATEMAKQFPHVDVLGIDLTPPTSSELTPSNCRFERHDVNDGMAKYGGKFDLIHARAVAHGCKDFHHAIKEFAQILRPGGVLIIFDGDPRVFDSNRQIITAQNPGDPGFSWFAKYATEMRAALKVRSQGIDAFLNYESWIKEMPEWDNYGVEEYFSPVGPWKGDDDETAIMQRDDMLIVIGVLRPALLANGHAPETVDLWIANVRDELMGLKAHTYMRWPGFWAIKKDDG